MKRLILESWQLLFRFEWLMHVGDFNEVCQRVRKEPIRAITAAQSFPKETLCRAIDYACVFYFKPVLCLQRSAATTILLRRFGWSTEMVIGAQLLPFKSHAWCEFRGTVVNDKPYVHEIYQVLERC